MDPHQFLIWAQGRVRHGAYPVEFRSAISRAYYAVFQVGRNLLKEMGFNIAGNAPAHEEVYQHLRNSGDDELAKAASKMNDLRTRRNHADYRLDRSDVEKKENASMHVQQAARLIETIEKRCRTEKRSKITAAIQEWKNRRPSG